MQAQDLDQTASSPKWLGFLGIAFGALFGAGALLTGNQPKASATSSSVISFYRAHDTITTIAISLILLSCVALAFFSGALRSRVFPDSQTDRGLISVSALGTAVWISGVLLNGALLTAVLDASHDRQSGVAQSINYLASDAFFPVVIGLSIFCLATGIGMLRSRAVPRWLAIFTVALGVLALAGPLGGIAFLVAPAWAIATGIVVLAKPVVNQNGSRSATMVATA